MQYVPISMDDLESGRRDADVPADVVGRPHYLFTEVFDGRNAHTTNGVQRALGREPRDFADFARDAAAAGVRDAQ